MHIIEHSSDTIQYTVLNLARLGLPFFLLSFAQENHLFLDRACRECSSAGCAARDRCVPSAVGWTCKKSQKNQNICFCFHLELGATWLITKYKHWLWMATHYPLWVLFLKYKAQCQLFFASLLRTGLYNQSNIQFKKLLLHVVMILCLFFMANLSLWHQWKALIGTHFSVRLAFLQEFCYSSVSLAWQTKDFSPLGNKTNVFQEGSRWALPT